MSRVREEVVMALLVGAGVIMVIFGVGWYVGYHMAVADFFGGKHGPTACDGKREPGHPWSPVREWEK